MSFVEFALIGKFSRLFLKLILFLILFAKTRGDKRTTEAKTTNYKSNISSSFIVRRRRCYFSLSLISYSWHSTQHCSFSPHSTFFLDFVGFSPYTSQQVMIISTCFYLLSRMRCLGPFSLCRCGIQA